MVRITGEYQGELHCTARHEPSGNQITTDAPKDNQGRGEAFSPTDLIATAFATCVATTMAIAARKQGLDLGAIRYEVTKEMSADAPRRITRLALQLWMPPTPDRQSREFLEKVAHGCPVHRALVPEVEKPITFHWPD